MTVDIGNDHHVHDEALLPQTEAVKLRHVQQQQRKRQMHEEPFAPSKIQQPGIIAVQQEKQYQPANKHQRTSEVLEASQVFSRLYSCNKNSRVLKRLHITPRSPAAAEGDART